MEKGEGCWIWKGGLSPKGYGKFADSEFKTVRAHRYSYELNVGEIKKGLNVLHRCDNPSCVRPDHLFLGTQKENMEDMFKKGRKVLGEVHKMSKTTKNDVLKTRELSEVKTLSELAEMFGLGTSQVHRIIKKQCWRHV